MSIPSAEEIRALHERYAPTRAAFDLAPLMNTHGHALM